MPTRPTATMDGKRLQTFWSSEADALVRTYRQFETLIPASERRGAAHPGEDGHYVEALVRSYVRRIVPAGLDVLSGFVLRLAVKTGPSGQERKGTRDANSGQIDIIVYDSSRYPVFQRFEEVAVVPPEGVVALISVKKTLSKKHIHEELDALRKAARLCSCLTPSGKPTRAPFLAIVGMTSSVGNPWSHVSDILKATCPDSNPPPFDELVGLVSVLDGWSVFKTRPRNATSSARYVYFDHQEGEAHLFFQFLATGILSVLYDPTRSSLRRPGFTAFESGRMTDNALILPVSG